MKVVISTCFGGFGLSTEAMKRAIAEGAAGISVHDEQEYTGGKGRGIGSEQFHDVGDGYEVGWTKDVLYKDGKVYTHDDHKDDVRADPVLVRIVEEMGEAANGQHACLHIVEVPDDAEWEISEYDGNEHIAEKHRTWP